MFMREKFINNLQTLNENGRAIKVFNRDSGDYFTTNRPFPNLVFFQILLFHLYLKNFVNELVIYPQKK